MTRNNRFREKNEAVREMVVHFLVPYVDKIVSWPNHSGKILIHVGGSWGAAELYTHPPLIMVETNLYYEASKMGYRHTTINASRDIRGDHFGEMIVRVTSVIEVFSEFSSHTD